MNDAAHPIALNAEEITALRRSSYPEPYALRMQRRTKRRLGDQFGLKNFGVNLTTIEPGGESALRHCHTLQDEFVYVLSGEVTLITNAGETVIKAGMCAGFRAGSGDAHQLVNRSNAPAQYLEVGDRTPGDDVHYPDDDIKAVLVEGVWRFTRKDGSAF